MYICMYLFYCLHNQGLGLGISVVGSRIRVRVRYYNMGKCTVDNVQGYIYMSKWQDITLNSGCHVMKASHRHRLLYDKK